MPVTLARIALANGAGDVQSPARMRRTALSTAPLSCACREAHAACGALAGRRRGVQAAAGPGRAARLGRLHRVRRRGLGRALVVHIHKAQPARDGSQVQAQQRARVPHTRRDQRALASAPGAPRPSRAPRCNGRGCGSYQAGSACGASCRRRRTRGRSDTAEQGPSASATGGAAPGRAGGRALLGARDGAVQGGVVRPPQRSDARALHAPVLLIGLGAHGQELELLGQVRAIAPRAPGLRGLRGQAADEHHLRAAAPRGSARRPGPYSEHTLDKPVPAWPTGAGRLRALHGAAAHKLRKCTGAPAARLARRRPGGQGAARGRPWARRLRRAGSPGSPDAARRRACERRRARAAPARSTWSRRPRPPRAEAAERGPPRPPPHARAPAAGPGATGGSPGCPGPGAAAPAAARAAASRPSHAQERGRAGLAGSASPPAASPAIYKSPQRYSGAEQARSCPLPIHAASTMTPASAGGAARLRPVHDRLGKVGGQVQVRVAVRGVGVVALERGVGPRARAHAARVLGLLAPRRRRPPRRRRAPRAARARGRRRRARPALLARPAPARGSGVGGRRGVRSAAVRARRRARAVWDAGRGGRAACRRPHARAAGAGAGPRAHLSRSRLTRGRSGSRGRSRPRGSSRRSRHSTTRIVSRRLCGTGAPRGPAAADVKPGRDEAAGITVAPGRAAAGAPAPAPASCAADAAGTP